MYQFINNTIAVPYSFLVQECITERMLKHYRKQGYFQSANGRGCFGKEVLIIYDTIKADIKERLIKLMGEPSKVLFKTNFESYIIRDTAAQDFFRNHRLTDGKALPEETQKEYLINAEVLNAIHTIYTNRKAKRKALGGLSTGLFNKISEEINQLDKTIYMHSLPKNAVRLKDKYKKYIKESYQSLIHSNFCNDNSEKLNQASKLWILAKWTDQVNRITSVFHMYQEYNHKAAQQGWDLLKSEQTIYNFLELEEIKALWYGKRYGDAKAKEKYSVQHSTKLPTMRDSLWYSDGTKLNYFYLSEEGTMKTTSVYEVMDAYSEVLLGYHIADSEDYQTQYAAYRMAIQFAGHKPYQISFDNQGGHKKLQTGNFLTKIAHLSIRTKPYNGKSKTIESAFGRFQSQFLKRDWFFTGMNIQTKKDESKANMEFILANKKNLPSLNELKIIYKQRREEWNNANHPATGKPRIEMYNESQNPATPKISLWDMVDYFWVQREKSVKLNAYGLSFTEKGSKYTYMVYDENRIPNTTWVAKNIDKDFYIKFDPEDFSMIHLYEKDTEGLRFVTQAELKIEVHRGKQEQEEFEADQILKLEQANKKGRLEREARINEIQKEHGTSSEDYHLNNPGLLGLKTKGKKSKITEQFGSYIKKQSNITQLEDESIVTVDMY